MFVVRSLLPNCNAIIVKEIRRNLPRRDPGIYHRRKLLENDNDDTSVDLGNYDYDLETDFTNVGSSYEDHLQDSNKEREILSKNIVKQKYFKEAATNFLTWNDKEQIRYLHSTDPEEWSIEKLSEGFPALPHVIAKLVKPQSWEKKSAQKIQNHDKSVTKNWEMFKANKITNLSTELRQHLQKFTNRTLNLKPAYLEHTKKTTPPKIKMGSEFSDIIVSYQRTKHNAETPKQTDFSKGSSNNQQLQDTYMLSTTKQNKRDKHITLQQLQEDIVKKSFGGTVSPEEEDLLRETKKDNMEKCDVQIIEKDPLEISKVHTATSVVAKKKATKDYLLEYPEKIFIPKGIGKPGCTYRLNDCYYDDDGLFLYRVPGMYK
ncbi:hypothetical protein PPYR_06503 [Photinus pyralis]|uniref:Uncharacterized protein n=2 Tax=Photinus pyralis TaxID=7054 RepID=A0A5N4ATU7_PHOPY|nr:uncharacterized protein LOC116166324 [Photinus pyralis]KAB0800764.1 hypothetical protein PPYR_06503 [Photinus pyralis]